MNRRTFLRTAAVALPTAALPGQGPAKPPPNILLIVADDLGIGDLSSYGAQDLRTPNIDSIAARGVRFANFYANCPVCSPTRASLLTGCYPNVVGVQGVIRKDPADNWGYLAPQAILLPQLLRKAGYDTSLIGKWHLGIEAENVPNARGFQRFRGMLGGMLMNYYSYDEHQGSGPDMWRDQERIRPEGHATDVFTRWAVELIESYGKSSQPFFLYLAYNAPHDPVQPPEDWLRRVQARSAATEQKRARLVALIEHLDDGVGRVLAALRKSGREENTLVIFTSDNGGLLAAGAHNGPWRGGKGDVYEGGIRVPACACWPGRIRKDSSREETALSMDLAPTIAEAAGVRFPGPVDGTSLLSLLDGKSESLPQRDLFWSRREGNPLYEGRTINAVRRGDWKLLQNSPFAPLELYNVKDDPRERNNLFASRPETVKQLTIALRRHLQRGGAVPWQPPERRFPDTRG